MKLNKESVFVIFATATSVIINILITSVSLTLFTPRLESVNYVGKVVNKEETWRNERGILGIYEHVNVFKIQVQRDSDGWKRWFQLTQEYYENIEVGDHVSITDGKITLDSRSK